jgi:hypothetical protein
MKNKDCIEVVLARNGSDAIKLREYRSGRTYLVVGTPSLDVAQSIAITPASAKRIAEKLSSWVKSKEEV